MNEDRQTGRLRNATFIRSHICAKCHGLLTEAWDESVECRLRVVCSKNGDHVGFISKARIERRRQQELAEGYELHKAFPGLSGYTEPTPEEIAKDLSDLF